MSKEATMTSAGHHHPASPNASTGSSGRRSVRPGAGPAAQAYEARTGIKAPRIIAWEITRRCNLACAHCRASAHFEAYPGELSLDECKAVIDDIASITDPILILTGGEPLMRPDIWEIIDYANDRGLHPVVGTNGTFIDDDIAGKLHDHGIPRISVSLDFPDAQGQDRFRGKQGAFDETLAGIRAARAHGVDVQINTTITKLNKDLVDRIHDLSSDLGAVAFHPFLLVPTGRGENLIDVELSPQEYEEVMLWAYHRQQTSPMHFKPTDAPMYYRVIRQQAALEGKKVTPETYGMEAMTRGCLGGITFCFISHTGDVQPCGYFNMQLGNVKEKPFSQIWTESPVFDDLRHYDRIKGKCGACEFKGVCGGCRARALSLTGDYMQSEPYCAYIPKPWAQKLVLDEIQSGFPLEPSPVDALSEKLEIGADDVRNALVALCKRGIVRRVGGSFSASGLGYVSTLCAMQVPENDLDRVAAIVDAYPGVTHDYARDNRYSLWFTLIARDSGEIERILGEISRATGIDRILNLPATKVYKIRVDFSDASGKQDAPGKPGTAKRMGSSASQDAPDGAPGARPFDRNDPVDVELVRWAQGDALYVSSGTGDSRDSSDVALDEHPFASAAARISERTGRTVSEGDVIRRLRELLDLGVMRRFGAIVRHQKMGFAVNAMTAWDVPDDRLDEAGEALAASASVSHVYARPRCEQAGWTANLFGMVHAHTRQELDEALGTLRASLSSAGVCGIEPEVLISTREYKKTSMRYFEEDAANRVPRPRDGAGQKD